VKLLGILAGIFIFIVLQLAIFKFPLRHMTNVVVEMRRQLCQKMTNAWNVKLYGLGVVIGGKRLNWKKSFLDLQLRDIELIT
jgi:hypothetical protein